MSDIEAEAVESADPNTEARARAQGWRPKEEFKGPAERWRPADEFLKAAETFMPVAIERNRALEKKIDKLAADLAESKTVLSEFREFASRGEQRAYERAKADLLAKRDVAVAHADTETFKAVEREMAELEKVAAPPKREEKRDPVKPTVVPEIEAWVSENKWFNSDPVLHSVAKALDADYERTRPGLDIGERLAAVKAEIQKRFPEKFENPHREAPTAVSTPSGQAARKKDKRSYENLPPEAKRACDKFVKTIPGFKVEDYVRDFDWGFE